MKQNLRQYSDEELSLQVMNSESLYLDRHKKYFYDTIKELFIYSKAQLEVLKQDLQDDLREEQQSCKLD